MSLVSEDIKTAEGYMQFAFRDSSDQLHIGYGFNIDRKGGMGLSRAECDIILERRLKAISDTLRRKYGRMLWYLMGSGRRDALVELCYWLGLPKYNKFVQMDAAVRRYDWYRASKEVLNSKLGHDKRNGIRYRANRISKKLKTGLVG